MNRFTNDVYKNVVNDKDGVFGECQVVGCKNRWKHRSVVVNEKQETTSLYCDDHLEFHNAMHLRNVSNSRGFLGLSKTPVIKTIE